MYLDVVEQKEFMKYLEAINRKVEKLRPDASTFQVDEFARPCPFCGERPSLQTKKTHDFCLRSFGSCQLSLRCECGAELTDYKRADDTRYYWKATKLLDRWNERF